MKLRVQVVLYKPDFDLFEIFIKSLEQNLKSITSTYSDVIVFFVINEASSETKRRVRDAARRYLKNFQVNIYSNPKNLGHGSAHNKVFFEKENHPGHLWILNPDGLLDASCLELLTKSLLSKRNAVAVEAKQLPLDHPKAYNLKTLETSWLSGACLLIKSEAFRDIHGFDEKFFLHGDDVDLSYRLRKQGGKLYFIPNALFWHSKRVGKNGYPIVSLAESIYGPLGALIISWKFRQPIKLFLMTNQLKSSGSQIHTVVLQLFKVIKFESRGQKKGLVLGSSLRPWKFSKHRY